MKIIFKTQKITFEGTLNNTQTAQSIYEKLPFEARVNTWGEEIYFEIPVSLKPENSTLDVKRGDIAYWPDGSCLCVFFGRTPASLDDKPVPASEVNLVGKVTGDVSVLKKIVSGDKITVMKNDN